MDELRKPLFYLALAVLLLVVLVESGSSFFLPAQSSAGAAAVDQLADDPRLPEGSTVSVEELRALQEEGPPPGLALNALALLDVLLLFTIALIGAATIIPERVHGRVQGLVTLLASLLLVLIPAVVLILKAVAQLILMLALFLAIPFGTLAYLAVYGAFPREAAALVLGASMPLKLLFLGALFFAHQRFLENRGLMLLIGTSLAANFIIVILHGWVPGILVSITDAIAAIVVGVLAAVWAAFFLIGSLVSIYKAVRLGGG